MISLFTASSYTSSILLYSSTDEISEKNVGAADANTYRPFKVVDSTVTESIMKQVEEVDDPEDECELMPMASR